MARIIILTGMGEPEFSSNRGIIHAFKELGHDVITAGPPYWGRGYNADVPLPDKPHPEMYSYEEVLSKVQWQPDLFLNIEPHAFATGPKPPELISAFYATDQHRAGGLYHRVASQGNFNYVFIGQPYFASSYIDMPKTKLCILLPAFDERRFIKGLNTSPKVDISFVGQTGIAGLEFTEEDEIGRFTTKPPSNLPTDIRRYAFSGHPGFDYCERAELLIRLMKDFRVHIYEQVWEPLKFQKALQRGVVGFNRSLLNDISIRVFETMAAHRALVTDDPSQWLSSKEGFMCRTYKSYFKPFFQNFDLDYKYVRNLVIDALDTNKSKEEVIKHDFDLVWKDHSWRSRAGKILDLVFS